MDEAPAASPRQKEVRVRRQAVGAHRQQRAKGYRLVQALSWVLVIGIAAGTGYVGYLLVDSIT